MIQTNPARRETALAENILLFQSYTLREVTLPNRIVVSPMCQYSSNDGFANDWHLVHLGGRAVGGAGLIFVEATAVTPEGRITPWDMGLWKDEQIEGLARITRFISAQGSVPGIQLAHAGRKASTRRPWDGRGELPPDEGGWQVVAPSALPFSPTYPQPRALSLDEIQIVIDAFRAAAARALQAGFRVLEIHAAHGYLIHQFLSPLANQRVDAYGGSFEGRARLAREVAGAVRSVWPEHLPLFTRVSSTDWVQGGWSIEDSVQLASILKEEGVDLIDCSSGGNVPDASIPVAPGYQVPFAARIRREADVPTMTVGLITEAAQAESILEHGDADLIALAREELRDPNFPLHAARSLGYPIPWPLQYQRARD